MKRITTILIIISVAILLWAIFIWFHYRYNIPTVGTPEADGYQAQKGQQGDYVGGVIGTLLSFATVLMLIVNFIYQKRQTNLLEDEHNLLREERRDQKISDWKQDMRSLMRSIEMRVNHFHSTKTEYRYDPPIITRLNGKQAMKLVLEEYEQIVVMIWPLQVRLGLNDNSSEITSLKYYLSFLIANGHSKEDIYSLIEKVFRSTFDKYSIRREAFIQEIESIKSPHKNLPLYYPSESMSNVALYMEDIKSVVNVLTNQIRMVLAIRSNKRWFQNCFRLSLLKRTKCSLTTHVHIGLRTISNHLLKSTIY